MYFKEGPLPVLSKHEDDALDMVIYDLEMVAEEYIVDEVHHAIRQVWEVALRIGVKHGQQQARQAHVHMPKELERERVWGFDVGWNFAMEESALKTSKESAPGPSLPCLASFSTTATQIDPPSFPKMTTLPPTVSMQTEVLIPTPSSHLRLSPAAPLLPSPTVNDANTDVHEAPKTPSHDLRPLLPSSSVISLTCAWEHPFASLQQRHRRAPHMFGPHSSPPRSSRTPKTIILNIYDSNPKTLRVQYTTCSPVTPTSNPHPSTSTFDQNLCLDWGLDP
ncbi:hypothetical protein K438DRAFT_1862858 [Mycena galopus ATCC 62051]|nr:hypothetical protein K438DRAFT_1862858 [Mycena galopus ATCC 62051]